MKRIYNVSIMEALVARYGYGLKAKRPGQKKPYVEDLPMPDYSRSRGKPVHRHRVMDRENDRYFKKISDYQIDEIIHHCDEPLSVHHGRGDAKKKVSNC